VTAIVWASPLGETRYAPEQLPLEIGGSERDDLRIEGVGEATVAVLGSFDGRVFVRSTPSADVSVNDAPLVGSHFLVSRDSIRLGSTRIRCEERDGALALVVTEAGAATPAGADAPAAGHPDDRDDPVVPVEYQPVVQRQARTERRGPDWRVVGIGATAALLGVLLWFSLTAVSVRVASDPPADDLDLPRTLLKLQLGDRLLVRPGEHRLVVEKQGYYTLESVIEVGEASSQQLEFTLEKRPGLLRLTTEPDAGALVSVDGTEVGTTPLEPFELRPGSHALQIQAPRYVTWEGEIEIEGGDVEQALALELTQAWSSVSVTSTPPGAALRVGDEDLGTTPLTFELLAGEYELEAALAGYKRFATALHVDPNRALALDDIVLELSDARLRLTSEPAGAQVMVDESLAGRTPLELELATGEPHTLTLFKPGFELVTREVELERGEERELSLQLPPRYGVIELQLSPPDAEVTVAGRQVDASTGKLRLLALPQQIRVSKSGYAPRTLGVTPRPGAPQRLEVRLLTLAEHQKATTKREIADAAVLHRRARDHQPRVPRVPPRTPLVALQWQGARRARSARHLGLVAGRRALLQLAERTGRAAARLCRARRPAGAATATGHQLPAADRGGVDLGRSLRRGWREPALPVGRRAAAPVGLGELRRRLGVEPGRERHGRVQRRLRRDRSRRQQQAERRRRVRPGRQRGGVDAGLLHRLPESLERIARRSERTGGRSTPRDSRLELDALERDAAAFRVS
jgi:hypothetical protein